MPRGDGGASRIPADEKWLSCGRDLYRSARQREERDRWQFRSGIQSPARHVLALVATGALDCCEKHRLCCLHHIGDGSTMSHARAQAALAKVAFDWVLRACRDRLFDFSLDPEPIERASVFGA